MSQGPPPPRCEFFLPRGDQCTRPAIGNLDGRYWCGQSHNSATTGKVSRNGPCPCGSGKKYKRCCALVDRMNEVPRRLTR